MTYGHLLKVLSIFLVTFSTMAYEATDIKLNDFEFKRYVKPQLNSISQDFFSIYFILNPENKELKSFTKSLLKITSDLKVKHQYCYKKFEKSKCLKHLDDLINFFEMNVKTIEESPNLFTKEHFSLEDNLIAQREFEKLYSHFHSTYIRILNYRFLAGSIIPESFSMHKIQFELNQLYSYLMVYLIASSDQRFKIDFNSFWALFINPANQLVLAKNDKNLFISKLNKFNIQFNTLNMMLTKRNKPIPSQVSTLLKIMHNRWNNILKVTLR